MLTDEITFTVPREPRVKPIALLEAVLDFMQATWSAEEIDLIVEFVQARRHMEPNR